jgi:ADP-ribosylglycohydrolase
MKVSIDRVYGALIGQAVGDALGAPTEGMTREGIVARFGWVADFVTDDPVGTDDTEYAVFTARLLLEHGSLLSPPDVDAAWIKHLVNQQGGFFGGGFSEMTAINNLRVGLRSPQTGSDNHEMWSDGTAMRIAPVGVFCAGNPAEAARLAAIEGQVSHSRDGIYCGQALAAAVSVALVSTEWRDVVAAGVAAIPEDSWTARLVRQALDIASAHDNLEAAIDELYAKISILCYPWADVGPEATALAFGVFAAAQGAYVPAVLGGVNMGRDSDTIAAMAGAMAGALHGASSVPASWRDRINIVRGHCIGAVAGTDLSVLADELHSALPEQVAS